MKNKLFHIEPQFVQMVVTKNCNLSSSYCNEHENKSQEIDSLILKQRIDILDSFGTKSISLLGGEPLLHSQIIDLVEYSRSIIGKVSMTTNGYLLNERIIKRLNDADLSDLEVSIDNFHSTEISRKSFSVIKNKLDLLNKYAKFETNINVTYGFTEFDEVKMMVEAVTERGYLPLQCWKVDTTTN